MSQLLYFVAIITAASSFRCTEDVDLEHVNSTQFKIKIKKDANNKDLWTTRMSVFLFGEITDSSLAKIDAGFYPPDTPDILLYNVVINCKSKTWKTLYNTHKNKVEVMKWDEGILADGCPTGRFDLMAVIGCPDRETDITTFDPQPACAKHVYFVFNGNALITTNRIRTDYTSRELMTDLPVFIRKGRLFKANIRKGGAAFTRYTYGRCIAFPVEMREDCKSARTFVLMRSEYIRGLKYFGAWTMDRNVDCSDDNKFKKFQSRIIPDGAETYKFTLHAGFNSFIT